MDLSLYLEADMAVQLIVIQFLDGLYGDGHDLEKEIQFVEGLTDGDEIAAIQRGELDYAILGTGTMYQALNTDGIKIVAYNDDITPNYLVVVW